MRRLLLLYMLRKSCSAVTQGYVNSIECEKEFYFAESINLPMIYVHLEEMHYPFKCKRGETEHISGINLAYARSLY
ncbi:hypothetical protein HOLleu_40709 [Holothuria leucospilota]|uniref:Secreted protein n=1 Tax=Holothuria leucospilota TaxID=206669 RepID=A0A9Q0YIL6_HOLLE|nr:hypothetical protein HOLleu_40709 [Holothuria leucospilota]